MIKAIKIEKSGIGNEPPSCWLWRATKEVTILDETKTAYKIKEEWWRPSYWILKDAMWVRFDILKEAL